MVKKSILILSLFLIGCLNPNTGSNTIVGESTILPEISDSSDSVSVRVYKSLKGAQVWVAKDSKVEIEYNNVYTNNFFGWTSDNALNLKVKINPVYTNDVRSL